MSNNSNPVEGTGTANPASDEDGMDEFLGNSVESNPEEGDPPETVEETPDGEEPEGEEAPQDEQFVTLPDGTKKPFTEYEAERMMAADYTRKTQVHSKLMQEAEAKTARLAEQASLIDAQYQQLELSHAATHDFLAAQIPPEPDLGLMSADPQEYMRLKAYHDHMVSQLNQHAHIRQQQHAEYQRIQQANMARLRELENQKLEQAFPHIAGNPEKARAFHSANVEMARRYGFNDTDYENSDSRAKRLIARLVQLEGMQKARTTLPPQKGAPQVKVQGKPAVAARQVKDVQAFRQSGSAATARKAIDSGAFDHLL